MALTCALVARIEAQPAAGSPSRPATSDDQHAGHAQEEPTPAASPKVAGQDQHDHAHDGGAPQALPPFVPPLTDDDRKAAFPDVEGHAVHDQAMNHFILFDQFEWQPAGDGNGLNVDGKGWIGRDRDRLWIRTEGETEGRRVDEAQAHVLYGRQLWRWWDLVGGIRQDVRPGPAQTWVAVGVQGLAPYWFAIEATAYFGTSGRTQARFEVEYELLLTNRLVLQPLLEVELFGKSDPVRGIGAGLSTTEAGLRIRYEFRREVAPYIGLIWRQRYGQTADFAESSGEVARGMQFVSGVRVWF
jgi:copper resistance protein B